MNDEEQHFRLLADLVDSYGETDLEMAKTYARKGLDLARKSEKIEWEAHFLFKQGELHQMQGNYDAALLDFDAAIDYYRQAELPEKEADVLDRKAFTFQNQGKFEKAMATNMEALELYEALGDQAGIARIYVSLADVFFYMEKPEEGVEYGEKAIEIYQSLDDEEGLADAYQYTGDNYLALEKYDQALVMMDRALKIKRRLDTHPLALGSLINSRANVLKYLERYEDALEGYRESNTITTRLNHPGGMSATLANMGDVYMRMGRYEEALPIKMESVELQEKHNFAANLMENYQHLSTIHKELGNFRQALDFHEKYAAVRDSMVSVKKDEITSELQTRYETEKKEALIASQEERLSQQRTIQWFMLGVAALLVIILFLLYRSSRIKQKANEKLATVNSALAKKNKENELLLKEIHHRVKNNLQTISSLLNLQSASIDDATALEAVRESQSRVRSMALIHQKLYQGENLAAVEMKDYFKTMGETMLETFGDLGKKVTLQVDMNEIELDVDTAIPIGLIVNELMTNSLKYAFPGQRKGRIEISLVPEQDTGLCLKIADNGIGLEGEKKSKAGPGTGFGGRLISLLTMQLGGKMEQRSEKDAGTATLIRFKPVTAKAA